MSTPQDDAAICAAMVREFDFPRYAASLFAAPDKRRAMLALAAFDLEIRRIPDQVTQPLPGEVRLQWWLDAIDGTEHGSVAGHPVAAELLHAMKAESWPREPLLALIEAHKFDLYDEPMPTLAALEVYCDDIVGSLVGIVSALPMEHRAVRDTGQALGLSRLVAHLAHNAAHRRCYVPDDLLAACGTSRASVLAGEDSAQLREARAELIAAARRSLLSARREVKHLPRDLRPAFLPLASLAAELNALDMEPPFTIAPPASRLRVLTSQAWMMRFG